jgi:hypothetical protein
VPVQREVLSGLAALLAPRHDPLPDRFLLHGVTLYGAPPTSVTVIIIIFRIAPVGAVGDDPAMPTVTVVGVDPGVAGGITCLFPTGEARPYKMPTTPKDLLDLLTEMRSWGATHAVLEEVQPGGLHRGKVGGEGGAPMQRMGSKSAFMFGRGIGRLETALIATGFVIERARPAAWQLALGCRTKGDKNVSKRRAQELQPGVKVVHWNADSILLAHYGARLWNGGA